MVDVVTSFHLTLAHWTNPPILLFIRLWRVMLACVV